MATAAAENNCVFDLPSLFQVSTAAVLRDLSSHEESLCEMPDSIKQAILHLMSKRGFLTDDNLLKVLFPRLRCLDLSISQVTDKGLQCLPLMRYLQKVDLNSFKEANDRVSSAGIISLCKACPNLQILYLRRNINVTDEAVLELCKNCPYLREFNVGGCFLLTDASLAALGQYSIHLKSLNISSTQITDDGIRQLCNGRCSQLLTEVDMSSCTHLTDEAVENLIMMCPVLRILLFARCPKITENSRVALEERFLSSENAKMKQVSWTIY
ncbi:protein amn1 homolog [Plakobranchus ocellatus]|uniref:Protein amn1 homolog n=1 Tax=Plakobranchus ocellatus TaxID=259542 RepID=A0AAV3YMY0_9GAST|nr:protein amn1 homolog [Plakobranchus ocellatus]